MCNETNLPLLVRGYEANTVRDVYHLTKDLDADLAKFLESQGYIYLSNIKLSDGQFVDGWVRL